MNRLVNIGICAKGCDSFLGPIRDSHWQYAPEECVKPLSRNIHGKETLLGYALG